MLNRLVCLSTSIAIIALIESTARAEALAPIEPPDWSFGVGVGFSSITSGSIGALGGGLGGFPFAITYGVAVERRVSGPLWFRFQGGLQSSVQDGGDSYGASSLGYYTTAGARLVIAEVGPVAISGLASVGASGGRSRFETANAVAGPVELGGRFIALHGALGAAVEHRLAERLSLRLAADLASLTWGHARTDNLDDAGQTYTTEQSSLSAALQVSPSLELRVEL